MTKSVAILGCGPAGLLAAHAAVLSGWDFHIYSRKEKSKLYGAQYLHAPIPGLDTGDPKMVRYVLRGTPEEYRRKVYGDSWDGTTSPEDLMNMHGAWDIRAAYDKLWSMYEAEIGTAEINHHSVKTLRGHWDDYDLVISSVPRTVWDDDNSHFERTYVWALGDTDVQRIFWDRPDIFTVMCDGTSEKPWYRVSNIFGYATIEWPQFHMGVSEYNGDYNAAPRSGASLVTKPLRYTGNEAKDFVHVGRYGKWQKGVLTTDAFFDSMKALANDNI